MDKKSIRLALLQESARSLDIIGNTDKVEQAARVAAHQGADLLLTPELFTSGYAPDELAEHLEPADLEEIDRLVRGSASRHGIHIAYSRPIQEESGHYIGAFLMAPSGNHLLEYRKTHLFGTEERRAFHPSDTPPDVAEVGGMRVGFLICFDVEFPETARMAAHAGVDLILVPTALGPGYEHVPRIIIPARAVENQAFVAYANHSLSDDRYGLVGGSVICGPSGELISAAGRQSQLIVVDLEEADLIRARGAFPYLSSRRRDVYRHWMATTPEDVSRATK